MSCAPTKPLPTIQPFAILQFCATFPAIPKIFPATPKSPPCSFGSREFIQRIEIIRNFTENKSGSPCNLRKSRCKLQIAGRPAPRDSFASDCILSHAVWSLWGHFPVGLALAGREERAGPYEWRGGGLRKLAFDLSGRCQIVVTASLPTYQCNQTDPRFPARAWHCGAPGTARTPNRLSPSGNSFCVARPLD